MPGLQPPTVKSALDWLYPACGLVLMEIPDPKNPAQRITWGGTCFLVTPRLALTAAHVLHPQRTSEIQIFFQNQSPIVPKIEAAYPDIDIAILDLGRDLTGIQIPALWPVEKLVLEPGPCGFCGYPLTLVMSKDFICHEYQAELTATQTPIPLDPQERAAGNTRPVRHVVYSKELAAGTGAQIQGTSGSPLVLGRQVIGIIVEVQPDLTTPKGSAARASNGVAYARPIHYLHHEVGKRFSPGNPIKVDPRAPYQRQHYVNRPEAEMAAQDHLEQCIPIILWGPGKIGKTRVLTYLKEQTTGAQASASPPKFFEIELELAHNDSASYDQFLRWLAETIARQIDKVKGAAWVQEVWSQPISSNGRFEQFMESHVFSELSGLLIFCLNRLELLWQWPHVTYQEAFSLMLQGFSGRATRGDASWQRVRWLIEMSTSPVKVYSSQLYSPINKIIPILIEEYTQEQIQQAANISNITLTSDEITALFDLTCGHPYFVHMLLYHAARLHGVAAAIALYNNQKVRPNKATFMFYDDYNAIKNISDEVEIIRSDSFKQIIKSLLAQTPGAHKVLPSQTDRHLLNSLERVGLIRALIQPGQYEIRNQIYRDMLKYIVEN